MPQHLFIVGMNDSGTTYLQNALTKCANCVAFNNNEHPFGLEGQAAAFWHDRKQPYPRDTNQGVIKVFSEKKEIWQESKHWNWPDIKAAWEHFWRKNSHYKTAKDPVFLEKTPMSLFALDMYLEHFPEAKFLFIIRNPYAVCEGMRRTVSKYKGIKYYMPRCIRHWIECSKQQMDNIGRFCPDRGIWFTYNDLVTDPTNVAKKIVEFIPALHDLSFEHKTMCHSMDGNIVQSVRDYNKRQIENLSVEDITIINDYLADYPEIMNFFGFNLIKEDV